jgi:ParB family chromosome partitioning protein
MGHARALLGVDDPNIQRNLANKIIEKGFSVRETERTIKNIISGVKTESKSVSANFQEDANIKSAEVKLQRRLSSKVQVILNQTTGGGKIEIKFYDQTDLNRIYEIIMGKDVLESPN